jgi:uncharacterized membrane protein YsdA (DUF1294 family)
MKLPSEGCYVWLTFGLTVTATALVWAYKPSLSFCWAWLIAINAITLGTFAYDKTISETAKATGATRVPEEKVLLMLTFFGGTPAALLAMPLFHHKTKKESFRRKFWLVVLLQILLVVAYFAWLKPTIGGSGTSASEIPRAVPTLQPSSGQMLGT